MSDAAFKAFVVERDSNGQIQSSLKELRRNDLPADGVLIKANWSSLNFKDALASTGHSGVVRRFPHVPGIDVAGEVVDAGTETGRPFTPGQQVIVTGFDFGAGRWGGWSEYVRVPSDWIVVPPAGLNGREAMMLGTAGFTAAQCVDALIHNGVEPNSGEVVVTGATGGVGCLAVMILAKLGYTIVAVSGKADWKDRLLQLGVKEVIGREAAVDNSGKPLLPGRWAGVVDTVGGSTLATLIRQCKNHACVSACGLVGGTDLPLTVYPFILRGITLAGIDSAWYPLEKRQLIWSKLAGDWRLDNLESITTETTLEEVSTFIPRILKGEVAGRTLVRIT